MKRWTCVKNIAGLDIYLICDDNIVYELTTTQPQMLEPGELPEKLQYIADFLSDHTKKATIAEALKDFDLSWATSFQKNIYKALAEIPCGRTISYGKLAELAGHPKAYRAVGSAMNKNRFMIALPCHRVIAAGGKIGGFASGTENKKLLLKTEGIYDLR
ncbi:MAG: cysteine methyltransferase [Denitrovibrio sp.]|nr:MAG: cysteine methyltransferase [Denitrovibrio sp.]